MGGRGVRDRRRRSWPGRDHEPLVRRVGRASAGPRRLPRLPLFTIERIGDAPPRPLPAGDRPLSGIRVLDLTRVIAGPVCGRTLAAHGADVLWVTARHLPKMEPLVIDNGRGKLSTALDLRDAAGRATLAGLLRDADIFVQGYRPGAIAAHGFGPQDAARTPPRHRLCLALRLWPRGAVGGPPRLRFTGAERQRPQCRRGGGRRRRSAEAVAGAGARSWHRLSDGVCGDDGARAPCAGRRELARARLARPDRLTGCGRSDASTASSCPDPGFDDVRDRLEESDSGFGRLTTVRHAAVMSETPPHWARPSVPLGTHPPAWL